MDPTASTIVQFMLSAVVAAVVTVIGGRYFHLKQVRRHLRFLLRETSDTGRLTRGASQGTSCYLTRFELRNDGSPPVVSLSPIRVELPSGWCATRVDVIATAPAGLHADARLAVNAESLSLDVPVLNPGNRVVGSVATDRRLPLGAHLTLYIDAERLPPQVKSERLSEAEEGRERRNDKNWRGFLMLVYGAIAYALVSGLLMDFVLDRELWAAMSQLQHWTSLATYAMYVLILAQGVWRAVRFKWDQGVSSTPGSLRTPSA